MESYVERLSNINKISSIILEYLEQGKFHKLRDNIKFFFVGISKPYLGKPRKVGEIIRALFWDQKKIVWSFDV